MENDATPEDDETLTEYLDITNDVFGVGTLVSASLRAVRYLSEHSSTHCLVLTQNISWRSSWDSRSRLDWSFVTLPLTNTTVSDL